MECFNNDSSGQCVVLLVGVCFMFQFCMLGIACFAHATVLYLHGFWTHVYYSFIYYLITIICSEWGASHCV